MSQRVTLISILNNNIAYTKLYRGLHSFGIAHKTHKKTLSLSYENIIITYISVATNIISDSMDQSHHDLYIWKYQLLYYISVSFNKGVRLIVWKQKKSTAFCWNRNGVLIRQYFSFSLLNKFVGSSKCTALEQVVTQQESGWFTLGQVTKRQSLNCNTKNELQKNTSVVTPFFKFDLLIVIIGNILHCLVNV